VATVPVGGGVAVGLGHLLLEGRVVYRFTFFDDLLAANHQDGDLRSTTAVGSLGYVF
jgi:hypothetical protein